MDTTNVVRGEWLEDNEIDIEYRLRAKDHFEKSIDVGSPIPKGWGVKTEYKTKIRIIIPKYCGGQ